MPAAVAAVTARDPAPGKPWILNDPYAGGTHLPDLTIVTRTELGFAVSRAHHADVGGSEPGSLPPRSRTLDEEGQTDKRLTTIAETVVNIDAVKE
jgi:N-methylhydantoinase B